MKKNILFYITVCLLTGCVSSKKLVSSKINTSLQSNVFNNSFTGFLLIDAKTKDTLYNYNGRKYFTPGSNVKLFTLFASLQLLPKNTPALKYITKNDTLYIEGTGDPSFLNTYFKDNTTLNFLKKHKHIKLHLNNFKEQKYAPGWAWEDFSWYYSPERSGLPLFGNVVTISNNNIQNVYPKYFKNNVFALENHSFNRAYSENKFYINLNAKDTIKIPFITNHALAKKLLEATINRKIDIIPKMPNGDKKTVYSVPTDSLYKRLLHESDNFIGEQLLLVGASTLSDTLNSKTTREFVIQKHLSGLPQKPRWVDGSGLSRYNLFTPESMVYVLDKIYTQLPEKKIFTLFPAGGVNGTIKNMFKGNAKPYIHAKSGSLGNNYCLSGYLITNSGKTLIFSFMNNHFTQPSYKIKKQIEFIFEGIKNHY